jgi:dihydroorotase
MIPSSPIYTSYPYLLSSASGPARRRLAAGCYNAYMTLVDITYDLQSPLTEDQLRHLGQFANTYGLRSFRIDESKKQLSFEYDASRLRETQVAHVLGQAKIVVARKVN